MFSKKKPKPVITDLKKARRIVDEIRKGRLPTIKAKCLPITLENNEKLIWAVKDAKYLQCVTVLSTSRFHSQTVDEIVGVCHGLLALTPQRLYFWTPHGVIQEPYTKMVSYSKIKNGFQVRPIKEEGRLHKFITKDKDLSFGILEALVAQKLLLQMKC